MFVNTFPLSVAYPISLLGPSSVSASSLSVNTSLYYSSTEAVFNRVLPTRAPLVLPLTRTPPTPLLLFPPHKENVPTSFFEYMVSDLPAIPVRFDGTFSYSTRRGAYHAIMAVLKDPNNPDEDLLFFCMKKAPEGKTYVSIQPPYPIQEAAQITSRYATFWLAGVPEPTSAPVPDQYCKLGYLASTGEGVANRVSEFSYQVYHDWVVFSGKTVQDGMVEIVIKKVENGQATQVVKSETVATQGKAFSYTTHLPPGEYSYEILAYTPSSQGEQEYEAM